MFDNSELLAHALRAERQLATEASEKTLTWQALAASTTVDPTLEECKTSKHRFNWLARRSRSRSRRSRSGDVGSQFSGQFSGQLPG